MLFIYAFNKDLDDAQPFHGHHFVGEILERDDIMEFSDTPELFHDEPADGIAFGFDFFGFDGFGQFREEGFTEDIPAAVGFFDAIALLRIELILDIANEFFECILDRNNARCTAVFIDDNG